MKILKFLKSNFSGGGIFIIASIFYNFLNFVFSAYLGRTLTVLDFGLVTFINTLVLLLGVFSNALGSSVTHRVAFLSTNSGKNATFTFVNRLKNKIYALSLILMVAWVALIPLSSRFFNIGDIRSLLFFTPVIILVFSTVILRGFLVGNLNFIKISIALIVEGLSKLFFAFLIQSLGYSSFTYLAVPLSLLVAFGMLIILSRKASVGSVITAKHYAFPRRFFIAAIITGLSTSSFLTVDLLLVRHYLLPTAAGEYALLSLAGKMIFFAGSLFNALILTFASRDLGHGVNPDKRFHKLILGTLSLTFISYVGIGILGRQLMPIAFGEKVIPILPYLGMYCLAIALFTVGSAFIVYHLARHHYSFSLISLFSASLLIFGIFISHDSIADITRVILAVSFINISLVLILHILQKNGRFLLRNLIDLMDVFTPLSPSSATRGKKILIFNWRDTRHVQAGGAEEYIHELAKRWVEKGNVVNIFCGNDGKCPRNETIDGVKIIRRGGFYFVYIWAFVYYVLRFRGKYDVIIDCQNGVPFFAPLYVKEKTFCLMFHVHQKVFKKSLPGPLALLASVLENRTMPWVYRKTNFITISNSTKQDMVNLGFEAERISIIYPGVDLSKLKPGVKSRNPSVLYLGRLKEYKSVDLFIKAAAKIKKDIPNAEFIIAGDGDYKEHLEKLAEKMRLKGKIKFLGKVTEEEKIKLYQKAWIFVNPSCMEGWGITSIEANACGTPVVASDVPGLRDSVNNPHSGLLFKYGNTKELTEKIRLLLVDVKMRRNMNKESILWAQNFNWNKSASESMRIIK